MHHASRVLDLLRRNTKLPSSSVISLTTSSEYQTVNTENQTQNISCTVFFSLLFIVSQEREGGDRPLVVVELSECLFNSVGRMKSTNNGGLWCHFWYLPTVRKKERMMSIFRVSENIKVENWVSTPLKGNLVMTVSGKLDCQPPSLMPVWEMRGI